MSSLPRCGRACSTSPTGAFSPWTGGSGSPRPARTCAGGSKTVPSPWRSRRSRPCPTGRSWFFSRKSNGMLTKRRRDIAGKSAPRLPDTIARLVQFTIVTRTARGRTKTSTIRVLTRSSLTRRSSPPPRSPSCTPKDGRLKSPTFI